MSLSSSTGSVITTGIAERVYTEADILARVNQITGRNETTITEILFEVLTDLACRTMALETEVSGTTVAGQDYINAPSDMAGVSIDSICVDGEYLDPITWHEFTRGVIKGYCFRANKIYVSPTPDAAVAYTVYYAKKHPADTTSILFPSTFQKAILHGVAMRIYENYEINDKLADQTDLYENEVRKLTGSAVMAPHVFPRPLIRI